MAVYRMNEELRGALVSAITAEPWDDEYTERMHTAVAACGDLEEIPWDPNEENSGADENATPVAALIEYFGLEHIALHV